jgi:hypothetical protein
MRKTRIAVLAVAGISALAAVPMAHAVQPAHPLRHKPRVINVTFTNSLGVSPLQVAARAERTLSHGKVAYGPNLSVYIARTKNYFAHALIIDCGDPPSLMQGMTSALAIEGTRIVALTCSTAVAARLCGTQAPCLLRGVARRRPGGSPLPRTEARPQERQCQRRPRHPAVQVPPPARPVVCASGHQPGVRRSRSRHAQLRGAGT